MSARNYSSKKVIIIGLDGFEPSIVESLFHRGELRHFARLRDQGFYSRLKTTYPALTPVAWSSFVTGANPGVHGIFDFVRRDPQTYKPELALSRFEPPRNMFVGPKVVNRRQGVPFWKILTDAGIPSVILRCPCTFPPEPISGRMLSGVGVPDLRGSQGTGTFYTQDRSVTAKESEQVVHLGEGDEFTTRVIGPRNGKTDSLSEIRVSLAAGGRRLSIRGPESQEAEIAERAWSPWLRLKFKLSMLQSSTGLVRFYVRRLRPHIEFYASPVNFDAESPIFPVSAPADYGKELAAKIGLFGTLGMAEDHGGLNNGRFDEDAYLEQCHLVLKERERMMFYELDRFQEGVLFVVFDTPDRVQHMFWRFRDPEHPCFDPSRDTIDEHYLWYDALLRRVLERVDENTLLMALSDHGFGAFRRAFYVNNWLRENGFLSLKDPDTVDWSRTSAYALGMSGIYLNIKGRESQGILENSGEAEKVRRAIALGLTGLGDPGTGRVAVRSVLRRGDVYSGPFVEDSPDLLLNCAPGFRVSWQSALGQMGNGLFEDNTHSWSGDHIVDPEAVPGVLFMNRKQAREIVDISTLAPIIVSEFLN